MSPTNGGSPDGPEQSAAVELQDVLAFDVRDGEEAEFEVVGIFEDDEDGHTYAVCYSEKEEAAKREPFIVIDENRKLLDNNELAQEILNDFRVFVEESDDEEKGGG